MNLELIKQELENLGYLGYYYEGETLVIGTSRAYNEDTELYTYQNIVTIKITGGKIIVLDVGNPIHKEEVFTYTEEAVIFIKELKPLG